MDCRLAKEKWTSLYQRAVVANYRSYPLILAAFFATATISGFSLHRRTARIRNGGELEYIQYRDRWDTVFFPLR